jgi:hypothetical protein
VRTRSAGLPDSNNPLTALSKLVFGHSRLPRRQLLHNLDASNSNLPRIFSDLAHNLPGTRHHASDGSGDSRSGVGEHGTGRRDGLASGLHGGGGAFGSEFAGDLAGFEDGSGGGSDSASGGVDGRLGEVRSGLCVYKWVSFGTRKIRRTTASF